MSEVLAQLEKKGGGGESGVSTVYDFIGTGSGGYGFGGLYLKIDDIRDFTSYMVTLIRNDNNAFQSFQNRWEDSNYTDIAALPVPLQWNVPEAIPWSSMPSNAVYLRFAFSTKSVSGYPAIIVRLTLIK